MVFEKNYNKRVIFTTSIIRLIIETLEFRTM